MKKRWVRTINARKQKALFLIHPSCMLPDQEEEKEAKLLCFLIWASLSFFRSVDFFFVDLSSINIPLTHTQSSFGRTICVRLGREANESSCVSSTTFLHFALEPTTQTTQSSPLWARSTMQKRATLLSLDRRVWLRFKVFWRVIDFRSKKRLRIELLPSTVRPFSAFQP